MNVHVLSQALCLGGVPSRQVFKIHVHSSDIEKRVAPAAPSLLVWGGPVESSNKDVKGRCVIDKVDDVIEVIKLSSIASIVNSTTEEPQGSSEFVRLVESNYPRWPRTSSQTRSRDISIYDVEPLRCSNSERNGRKGVQLEKSNDSEALGGFSLMQ